MSEFADARIMSENLFEGLWFKMREQSGSGRMTAPKPRKIEHITRFPGCCVHQGDVDERFIIPETATFDTLYTKRDAENIGELINQALDDIEEENKAKLEGVFRKIDFNNELYLGETKDRNRRLKHLLEDFEPLDLRPKTLGNADIIGDCYEYLISRFASDAGKKGGEFYTPAEVATLLARLLAPKAGQRVCDPACGSGSLLVKVAREIGSANVSVAGMENNNQTYALARMNMFLHGLDSARIEWCDTINSPKLVEDKVFDKIPKGWSYRLLDSLAARGSGHTPAKTKPEYWNGGIKWLSLTDSENLDRRWISKTISEISELGIRRSSAIVHPSNTVVLSRDGSGLGKSALIKAPMAVSQHFITWTCRDELNPLFLYYWLQYKKQFFRRMAVGSTIRTIGQELFQKLGIILPPFCEQRKIASILEVWDETIEKFGSLIEAQERRKRALMQQLLSRASSRAETIHTRQRIGEVLERVIRRNSALNDNVLTISAQGGLINQKDYFNRSVAAADLSGYYLLHRGEFAYNRSYSKGYPYGALKRLDQFDSGVVSTLYLCFRIKEGAAVSPEYLVHYFEGGRLNSGLRCIAKEGSRAHGLLNVTADEFFDLDIFLPSLPEQQKIAEILDTADQQLNLLRAQRTTLDQQKRGLMQRLLTGKLRVKTK